MTELTGRRVLVTGGSRGIGRGIVLALARAGATVVTCHRTESEAVESLRTELKEIGGDHHVCRADVTDPEQVRGLVEYCRTAVGGLDVVVHNAGAISHVPFAELTPAEWHRVVDTSLTAAYLVAHHALPLLGEGSSIITIGSGAALKGIPLRAHYTAAKAGLIGLTRSLAKELGPRGIRVNIVAPGIVDTEAEPGAADGDELAQRYRHLIAMGRPGRPGDVAAAVLFLAGPAAGFVTGETLTVDGGM